jgi:tRNA/rRNA methyltransferase
MSESLLDNVSIVLVNPRTPANIGAVARTMMNMGLRRLVLVNPLKEIDDRVFKLAAGAGAIIDDAHITDSLLDAVSGHGRVVGTSRHRGKQRKNIQTPRVMATDIVPLLALNRAAVLFGNEVNGLDAEALALCSGIVAIPSSEAFPSLNLSHAVMVIAYELFMAAHREYSTPPRELALAEEMEQFYSHLRQTLESIDFLDKEHPDRMMRSLRQLFARSAPDNRDVRILHGILSAVDRLHKK